MASTHKSLSSDRPLGRTRQAIAQLVGGSEGAPILVEACPSALPRLSARFDTLEGERVVQEEGFPLPGECKAVGTFAPPLLPQQVASHAPLGPIQPRPPARAGSTRRRRAAGKPHAHSCALGGVSRAPQRPAGKPAPGSLCAAVCRRRARADVPPPRLSPVVAGPRPPRLPPAACAVAVAAAAGVRGALVRLVRGEGRGGSG